MTWSYEAANARTRSRTSVDVDRRIYALVADTGQLYGLSDRESGVLLGGALGTPSKAVATELGCSSKTVDEYWRRIYRKTGCSSRQEIIALLLRRAVTVPSR